MRSKKPGKELKRITVNLDVADWEWLTSQFDMIGLSDSWKVARLIHCAKEAGLKVGADVKPADELERFAAWLKCLRKRDRMSEELLLLLTRYLQQEK